MSLDDKPRNPFSAVEPWDKVSEGYDRFTRPYLGKFSEKGLKELELSSEHKLLDVACGPGTTSLLALAQVGAIEALDFSERMVEKFLAHIKEHELEGINVSVGDGQSLPFADQTFERAVSMFGLMFFPDRVQGMKEMFRCLKKGGRVLISSWAPISMSPLMQLMFDAVRAANPETPAPVTNMESLENPEVFRRELAEAGFVNIRIEPCLCPYEYSSAGQLWTEMSEGGVPLVMARSRMSEDAWQEFSAKCIKHLEQVVADSPVLGSTAYLAFAER